jgi:hypothetical protein
MIRSDLDTVTAITPFRFPLGEVSWEEPGWFLGQPIVITVEGGGLVRVDQGQEKHLLWQLATRSCHVRIMRDLLERTGSE